MKIKLATIYVDDLDKAAYRSRLREVLDRVFDDSDALQRIKAGQSVTELQLSLARFRSFS